MVADQRILLCDGLCHQAFLRASHAPPIRLFACSRRRLQFSLARQEPAGTQACSIPETAPDVPGSRCLYGPPLLCAKLAGCRRIHLAPQPRRQRASLAAPYRLLGNHVLLLHGSPAQEMMKTHLIIVACLVMLGFATAVAREEYQQCPAHLQDGEISRTLRCLLP